MMDEGLYIAITYTLSTLRLITIKGRIMADICIIVSSMDLRLRSIIIRAKNQVPGNIELLKDLSISEIQRLRGRRFVFLY